MVERSWASVLDNFSIICLLKDGPAALKSRIYGKVTQVNLLLCRLEEEGCERYHHGAPNHNNRESFLWGQVDTGSKRLLVITRDPVAGNHQIDMGHKSPVFRATVGQVESKPDPESCQALRHLRLPPPSRLGH